MTKVSARWIEFFALVSALLWGTESFGGDFQKDIRIHGDRDSKASRNPASVVASSDLANPVSTAPAWYSDPNALKFDGPQASTKSPPWRLMQTSEDMPPAWKHSYQSLGTKGF